ncbi:MAG: hypothetical protein LBH44_01890 [Treponema sp.]|jgi:hypothetical protein|nr:hypothetical protein [Treponema sp.]
MKKTSIDNSDDVNAIAETVGLPYPVRISNEISELLKPNAFLAGLGIQYEARINSVLGILKANMSSEHSGGKETMPKNGIIIPLPLVAGPYIREDMVSIKAELTDDGGTAEILLTAVLDTE